MGRSGWSFVFALGLGLGACGDDQGGRRLDAAITHDGGADGSAAAVNPGIYVTNEDDAILVFALGSTGDVAPTRTIAGASTGLALPIGVVVDRAGNIYAANREGAAVTVYGPTATGDATPLRTLTATGMGSPQVVALGTDDDLYAASCPSCGNGSGGDVGVYHFAAGASTSDVQLTGSDTGLTDPVGLALTTAGALVIANAFGGSVETFAPAATADAMPAAMFTPAGSPNLQSMALGDGVLAVTSAADGIDLFTAGTNTPIAASSIAMSTMLPLQYPAGIALDDTVSPPVIYLDDVSANAIYIIQTAGAGADLTVASVATIAGSTTMLSGPLGITIVH